MDNIFSLAGKTILVTGASSGLGRNFAIALAEAGATIIGAARRIDALGELVAEITPGSSRLHCQAAHVFRRHSRAWSADQP